ncbi:MAG: laccase domain-containing protein, partial [Endomicrobia bacterium]|nr:laccase domain-containing protein [Endomicrobiia bacterium]
HICSNCYVVNNKKYSLLDKIKHELLEFSIDDNQLIASPYCTSCDNDLFYSYRKNDRTEFRIISAITYASIPYFL